MWIISRSKPLLSLFDFYVFAQTTLFSWWQKRALEEVLLESTTFDNVYVTREDISAANCQYLFAIKLAARTYICMFTAGTVRLFTYLAAGCLPAHLPYVTAPASFAVYCRYFRLLFTSRVLSSFVHACCLNPFTRKIETIPTRPSTRIRVFTFSNHCVHIESSSTICLLTARFVLIFFVVILGRGLTNGK